MHDDTMNALTEQISEAISKGFSDTTISRARKQMTDLTIEMMTSIEDEMKDEMSGRLAGFVQEMAQESIIALLEGNEDAMRTYLSCKQGWWTGRERDHSVIHGKLFETGAIELRRKIVEAHADLLKSERVLDLEDQVRSLVAQVNRAIADNEQLRERLRSYV